MSTSRLLKAIGWGAGVAALNNTSSLSYSVSPSNYPEQYAPCFIDLTNSAENNETVNSDENATKLPCNITAFFESSNLTVQIQTTPIPLNQCEPLRNETVLNLYKCFDEIDQNHSQYNNTDNTQNKQGELPWWMPLVIAGVALSVAGLAGLLGLACKSQENMQKERELHTRGYR